VNRAVLPGRVRLPMSDVQQQSLLSHSHKIRESAQRTLAAQRG
jgi:hypothetical protein